MIYFKNQFRENACLVYKIPSKYSCFERNQEDILTNVINFFSFELKKIKKDLGSIFEIIQKKKEIQLPRKLITTDEFEHVFSISKKQQAAMRGLRNNRLPFVQVTEHSAIFYDLEKVTEYFDKNTYL